VSRVVGIVTGVLVVLGVVGWLLWPSPPGATDLHGASAHYAVDATIDSPRMGNTSVDIALTGSPATVTVEAVMPLMGMATPALPATPAGGGHYAVADVPLMMTGPWELHVTVGTEDIVLPFTVSG
jgi:hypothetical protein